ncbi:Peroxin-3 [Annulohypoxylon truncatum]|uniref:Peroxin-3 n=1 Tax=Annulohypoxylon truncatum TaxID=327061 RepID=UPI0020080B19|nr:Peroxin-3 [Annulohypoxylon truncatum]KAI1212216.1 Peroxin-3 [Annulohypoxylon truncatum]
MISASRRWLRRNRTPIAIGVGVIGAGYLATQYVLSKINDARERMSSDRIAKENLRRRFEQNQEDCTFTVLALLPTATSNILETMNTEKITLEIQQMKSKSLRNSGESSATPPSIADTTMTEEEGKSIVSLESGVHASQLSLPPMSSVGDGSQDGSQVIQRPNRKTKRQLWDDLTISSITRAFTLIYTLALLTMLTRIQLNLLGRRSYLSSVVSLATGTAQSTISLENNDDDNPEHAYGSDFETNRKYLTFSWWLLHRGWVEIMENVEGAVREVFGHLSPRDLLSFNTFSLLTIEVRKKMEGRSEEENKGARPGAKWLPFLLPPTKMEDFVLKESGVLGDSASSTTQPGASSSAPPETSLRRLLDETSDLIESPAFTHVLTLLLDAGFSTLLYKKLLPGAFDTPGGAFTSPPAADMGTLAGQQAAQAAASSKIVLLPKILSVLTRQAHVIGNGMPNEYLQDMEQVRDLEAFAAVVYSSNWENEIHQDDGAFAEAVAKRTAADEKEVASSSRSKLLGLGPEGAVGRFSQTSTVGEESMVLVDPSQSQSQSQLQSSFESAWGKATDGS